METLWDVGLYSWGPNASFDTNIDIQSDQHMEYDNVIYAEYDINDKKDDMTYVIWQSYSMSILVSKEALGPQECSQTS